MDLDPTIIIEIPIEVLNVEFIVDKQDPLNPLFDSVNISKNKDISSQSIYRLNALSILNSNSEGKTKKFSFKIYRDLWQGKYWTPRIKNESIEDISIGSIVRLDAIEKIDVNKADGHVKDILQPYLGIIAREVSSDRKEIESKIRLNDLKSASNQIEYLRTRVTQKTDKTGVKSWIYDEGPFQELISKNLHKQPGFEPEGIETHYEEREWPYSPEVKALHNLRNKLGASRQADGKFKQNNNKKNKKEKERAQDSVMKEASNILNSIQGNLKKDTRPRLNEVTQVVGFRQDMWDAALKVIDSSEKQVFILSSFSNPKFNYQVAEMLSEVTEGKSTEILLSFGEPDRGSSPDDITNTELYVSKLSKDKRLNLKGGISQVPTHSKIVVSDTGMIFICSCNLFSGSLESGILESGLLINDVECAKNIISIIYEERWVPKENKEEFNHFSTVINQLEQVEFELHLEEKISEIKSNIKNKEHWYAIPKLERMLLEIAERPIWSPIRTLEHRPFMKDCIGRFTDRLVLASDGLRSNGLDKGSINQIAKRATDFKSSVHIWWGRHPPKSKPLDEVDKRGRNEAKKQLNLLRQKCEISDRSNVTKGTISSIHDKGFGFARTLGKKGEYYFIKRSLVNKYKLIKGDSVEFISEQGNKGPQINEFTKVRKENTSSNFYLYPSKSNEPMETHVKTFIVDELRLMMTSDNTLSFGDTESERGDAGELGISIDHPRLAIQTRGSMESWLPDEVIIPGDKTRWWSLLGEELSYLVNEPSEKILLMDALDALIDRIESNDFLKNRWEVEIESNAKNEIDIVNNLALGVKFGIYAIAESEKSQGVKTKLKREQIDSAVISMVKKNIWQKIE